MTDDCVNGDANTKTPRGLAPATHHHWMIARGIRGHPDAPEGWVAHPAYPKHPGYLQAEETGLG